MAVTFDGEDLIITLDSGVTSIDWIDVYSAWKDWLLESPTNRGYPQAFRTTGGDPLNELLNSGAYWFLRNDYGWRIKPPEEDITILAAGNLAPEDANIDMFLPTVGTYTTQILGLQPITQGFSTQLAAGLEYSLFGNGIHIDVINGYSGTGDLPNGDPIGTSKTPSNNLTDAKLIATEKGFDIVRFVGNFTFVSGDDVSDYILEGENPHFSKFTFQSGSITDNVSIIHASVEGVLNGVGHIEYCDLLNVTDLEMELHNCILKGNVTLFGAETVNFINCCSGIAGVGTPEIDMGGSGRGLGVRAYAGGLKITNLNSTENISVDFISGQLKLDASVTAGIIVVRGSGIISEDFSTGTTIVDGGLTNPAHVADHVWNDPDPVFLLKMIRNKKSLVKTGSIWELIIYDNDDATPILNKALKDKDGGNITDLEAGTLSEELPNSV